jgi:creatinine amidohydrolase
MANFFSDCTSEEVQHLLKNNQLLIPIGAIEQHGPHLPLSVDIDIATAIVTELSNRGLGMVAPGIAYAARSQPHSGGGPSFPGTIYVKGDTLINYFVDVFKCYARNGAKQMMVINGHYENEPFIFEALDICREQQLFNTTSITALSWWNVVDKDFCNQ